MHCTHIFHNYSLKLHQSFPEKCFNKLLLPEGELTAFILAVESSISHSSRVVNLAACFPGSNFSFNQMLQPLVPSSFSLSSTHLPSAHVSILWNTAPGGFSPLHVRTVLQSTLPLLKQRSSWKKNSSLMRHFKLENAAFLIF